jgi:hypothetical protein
MPAEESARSTAGGSASATTDQVFVPPSPAELWPEVFSRPVQASVSRFTSRSGENPQAVTFREFPHSGAKFSSVANGAKTPSTAEHRFPHAPVTAIARPAPIRSSQSVDTEDRWPEDLQDLWPELPHVPDHAWMEGGRAMRQRERTIRLDREQRGEF